MITKIQHIKIVGCAKEVLTGKSIASNTYISKDEWSKIYVLAFTSRKEEE